MTRSNQSLGVQKYWDSIHAIEKKYNVGRAEARQIYNQNRNGENQSDIISVPKVLDTNTSPEDVITIADYKVSELIGQINQTKKDLQELEAKLESWQKIKAALS